MDILFQQQLYHRAIFLPKDISSRSRLCSKSGPYIKHVMITLEHIISSSFDVVDVALSLSLFSLFLFLRDKNMDLYRYGGDQARLCSENGFDTSNKLIVTKYQFLDPVGFGIGLRFSTQKPKMKCDPSQSVLFMAINDADSTIERIRRKMYIQRHVQQRCCPLNGR